MKDWRNTEDYSYTHGLNAAQWAWEFLRRNPHYREEWQAFRATWRALEAAYGKVGRRDVRAWKLDPRAWVPAAECEGGDCRVDGDKVLIECAMGARWGFYKFPPDPDDDDPVGAGRLNWRGLDNAPDLVIGDGAADSLPAQKVNVTFDLSLPLAQQLLSAKRQLQIEQRKRIKCGVIKAPKIAAHCESLAQKLRLLDALDAGVALQELAQQLYAGSATALKQEQEAAFKLRGQGYLRLLLLD